MPFATFADSMSATSMDGTMMCRAAMTGEKPTAMMGSKGIVCKSMPKMMPAKMGPDYEGDGCGRPPTQPGASGFTEMMAVPRVPGGNGLKRRRFRGKKPGSGGKRPAPLLFGWAAFGRSQKSRRIRHRRTPLQQGAAQVGERVFHFDAEARGSSAVDDPVIVTKNESGGSVAARTAPPVPDPDEISALAGARMPTSGALMIGVNVRCRGSSPAHELVNVAPGHVGRAACRRAPWRRVPTSRARFSRTPFLSTSLSDRRITGLIAVLRGRSRAAEEAGPRISHKMSASV